MGLNLEILNIQKGFKKVDNTKIEDLESYIFEVMSTHRAELAGKDLKISIGTDSIFKPKRTHWNVLYITTIAFTFGNHGTHLIYREDLIKGEWTTRLDLFTRLWREVEMSAELGKWMTEVVKICPEIHLDINPKEKYQSNQLFNAAKGYIAGLGFDVQLKPDAAIASCAADHFLQKKTNRKYVRKNKAQSVG